MKNLIDDICRIISTIMPNEEAIEIYKEQTDNTVSANLLLDLLHANIFFKILVVGNSKYNDDTDGNNSVINDLKALMKNHELNREWNRLSNLHLHYMLDNYENIHPAVYHYLKFELSENSPDEDEQGDNEEVIISYLDSLVEEPAKIIREEASLRLLLECIVILDTHILEEERFGDIIRKNMRELEQVLAYED